MLLTALSLPPAFKLASSLQAKILVNYDLSSLGSAFEHTLSFFRDLCGSNVFLSMMNSLPHIWWKSWQGLILMLLRKALYLVTCSPQNKLSFLTQLGNRMPKIFLLPSPLMVWDRKWIIVSFELFYATDSPFPCSPKVAYARVATLPRWIKGGSHCSLLYWDWHEVPS